MDENQQRWEELVCSGVEEAQEVEAQMEGARKDCSSSECGLVGA